MVIIIIIYDKSTSNFSNNGLVVLSDCINCAVKEELNGQYELELEYPLGNNKWQYLVEENIIKADGQLYRIYHKTKKLTSIFINARHIFYDLLDNLLDDVRLTNLSGAGALDYILTHTQYAHNFTSMGDVGGTNTKYFIRKNVVEAIMGQDGIISTWGGELVRDNFTIKLLGQRGLDRGVLIAYGKNIQGIEETLDMDSLCTRLMPIGKDGLTLVEKYIDSQYINNFPHPKIKTVEFSDIETETDLRTAAQNYYISSKCDIPQFNYKIDFIELSKTEEYKNYSILETVYMGDTVTIKHSKLNINLKAKVIKITKNRITDRIENVELGSFRPNLATSINNSIQTVQAEIVNTKSNLQMAIDNATTQINSALGGYVVKRNGELLIMDTKDVNTATKVWRWNENGLGYSSTGYNGPYRTAITADGHMVADFMTLGKLSGGKVKFDLNAGTLLIGDSETDYTLYFDGNSLNIKYSSTQTLNEKINEVENEVTYKVEIISSQGAIFKNGQISTILTAHVYQGTTEVTDTIDANMFKWTRCSSDTDGDTSWNTSHYGGAKNVTITNTDVNIKATFSCEIFDV